MSRGPRIAAAAAGVLCANALPHLATAVTGRRMLTPLAGRDSPAPANALWGAMNLAGGLLLLRVGLRRTERDRPVPTTFDLGVAGFGREVRTGEVLARCGNSGNSTEPHLHLQVMTEADPVRARPVGFTLPGGMPHGGEIVELP